MDLGKAVGQKLKAARINAGYTQEQVAEKMSMSQQSYSRYERGIVELSYDKLVYLCKLFRISSDYLFDLNPEIEYYI